MALSIVRDEASYECEVGRGRMTWHRRFIVPIDRLTAASWIRGSVRQKRLLRGHRIEGRGMFRKRSKFRPIAILGIFQFGSLVDYIFCVRELLSGNSGG